MSGGTVCRCDAGRDRAPWRVIQREGNASAFSGYRWTRSAWSAIRCAVELGGCGAVWRTRARYVRELPDA